MGIRDRRRQRGGEEKGGESKRESRGGLCGRWPPEVKTEARGHLLRPVDGGVSVCQRCLEVTGDEAVEDGMGHEQDQPQREDRVGMVMKVMVGMPKRDPATGGQATR